METFSSVRMFHSRNYLNGFWWYLAVGIYNESCLVNLNFGPYLSYQPNFMRRYLSWEANSHLAGQQIHCLSWNPNIHCCVHKSPPLVPILSHMNLVYNFLSYFC